MSIATSSLVSNGNQANATVTVFGNATSFVSCLVQDTINGDSLLSTLPISWQPTFSTVLKVPRIVTPPVSNEIQTSPMYNCQVDNGSGSYTYAWSYVNGTNSSSATIVTPVPYKAYVVATMIPGPTDTGILVCIVTDTGTRVSSTLSTQLTWAAYLPELSNIVITQRSITSVSITYTPSVSCTVTAKGMNTKTVTGSSPLTMTGLIPNQPYTFSFSFRGAVVASRSFTTIPFLLTKLPNTYSTPYAVCCDNQNTLYIFYRYNGGTVIVSNGVLIYSGYSNFLSPVCDNAGTIFAINYSLDIATGTETYLPMLTGYSLAYDNGKLYIADPQGELLVYTIATKTKTSLISSSNPIFYDVPGGKRSISFSPTFITVLGGILFVLLQSQSPRIVALSLSGVLLAQPYNTPQGGQLYNDGNKTVYLITYNSVETFTVHPDLLNPKTNRNYIYSPFLSTKTLPIRTDFMYYGGCLTSSLQLYLNEATTSAVYSIQCADNYVISNQLSIQQPYTKKYAILTTTAFNKIVGILDDEQLALMYNNQTLYWVYGTRGSQAITTTPSLSYISPNAEYVVYITQTELLVKSNFGSYFHTFAENVRSHFPDYYEKIVTYLYGIDNIIYVMYEGFSGFATFTLSRQSQYHLYWSGFTPYMVSGITIVSILYWKTPVLITSSKMYIPSVGADFNPISTVSPYSQNGKFINTVERDLKELFSITGTIINAVTPQYTSSLLISTSIGLFYYDGFLFQLATIYSVTGKLVDPKVIEWGKIAVSTRGQYAIAIGGTSLYISTTYGESYTQVNGTNTWTTVGVANTRFYATSTFGLHTILSYEEDASKVVCSTSSTGITQWSITGSALTTWYDTPFPNQLQATYVQPSSTSTITCTTTDVTSGYQLTSSIITPMQSLGITNIISKIVGSEIVDYKKNVTISILFNAPPGKYTITFSNPITDSVIDSMIATPNNPVLFTIYNLYENNNARGCNIMITNGIYTASIYQYIGGSSNSNATFSFESDFLYDVDFHANAMAYYNNKVYFLSNNQLYWVDSQKHRNVLMPSAPTLYDYDSTTYSSPYQMAISSTGRILICETGNNAIQEVGTGIVVGGAANILVNLVNPKGVAVDTAGNIYISDTGRFRVLKVNAARTTCTVLAGTGVSTNVDGPSGSFENPTLLVVDRSMNVYVADGTSLRKITPAGYVTTFMMTGTSINIKSLTIDTFQNIFVYGSNNLENYSSDVLFRVTPFGNVEKDSWGFAQSLTAMTIDTSRGILHTVSGGDYPKISRYAYVVNIQSILLDVPPLSSSISMVMTSPTGTTIQTVSFQCLIPMFLGVPSKMIGSGNYTYKWSIEPQADITSVMSYATVTTTVTSPTSTITCLVTDVDKGNTSSPSLVVTWNPIPTPISMPTPTPTPIPPLIYQPVPATPYTPIENGGLCPIAQDCISNYCNKGVCTSVANLIPNGVGCSNGYDCNSTYCNGVCTSVQTLIATGSTCVNSFDCASGRCNNGVCSTVQLIPDGSSCIHAYDCSSTYCNNGICTTVASLLPNGATCGNTFDCSSTYCNNRKCTTVASLIPNGSACVNPYDCQRGYCTNEKCTTVPSLIPNGSTCENSFDCSSTYCTNGKCTTVATIIPNGSACVNPYDCQNGYCTNGVCTTVPSLLSNGSSCTNGFDCIGTYCNNKVCSNTSLIATGSACSNSYDCISNVCTDGICASPLYRNSIQGYAITFGFSETQTFTSFVVACTTFDTKVYTPDAYMVLGSNDNNTWYVIGIPTNPWVTNVYTSPSFSPVSYSYLQFIITKLNTYNGVNVINFLGLYNNETLLSPILSNTISTFYRQQNGNLFTNVSLNSSTYLYIDNNQAGPLTTFYYYSSQAPPRQTETTTGDTITFQFSTPQTFTSFQVGVYSGWLQLCPPSYCMLGSNDNTTWTLVGKQTNPWTSTIYTSPSFSAVTYSYLKFVMNSWSSNGSYNLINFIGLYNNSTLLSPTVTISYSYSSSNDVTYRHAGDGFTHIGIFTNTYLDNRICFGPTSAVGNYNSGSPMVTITYYPE